MDLEEILHNLEEARDSQDWEMVDTCIETIRVLIDDYDEYNSEEDWGWMVSTDVIQQQSAAEIEYVSKQKTHKTKMAMYRYKGWK